MQHIYYIQYIPYTLYIQYIKIHYTYIHKLYIHYAYIHYAYIHYKYIHYIYTTLYTYQHKYHIHIHIRSSLRQLHSPSTQHLPEFVPQYSIPKLHLYIETTVHDSLMELSEGLKGF